MEILITGHTRGIGKFLFDKLQKYNLWGFSKSTGFDLTKLETFEKIKQVLENKILDVVILNAGVGVFGKFEENNLKLYEEVISLNLLANIRLLKTLEKNLTKKTKIIFIGSIISKKFMKYAAVYQASKFGLRGFSGGLKAEGKKVFIINPKIVDTSFHKGKIELNPNWQKTSLESIYEVVENIIVGKERRFEIDL